jgi:hypothetical protein
VDDLTFISRGGRKERESGGKSQYEGNVFLSPFLRRGLPVRQYATEQDQGGKSITFHLEGDNRKMKVHFQFSKAKNCYAFLDSVLRIQTIFMLIRNRPLKKPDADPIMLYIKL